MHALNGKHWRCVDLLLAHGAFVKSIFNVEIMCGDDTEACDKLTDRFYAAGGHNYVGEESSIAEEKRKEDREAKDDKEILPLYGLCRNYMTDMFTKSYPGTNLFPLIQSLPVQ